MSAKPSPHSSAPAFALGDVVRRKFSTEESGMIVGMTYRVNDSIEYLVSWQSEPQEHRHYAAELKLDGDFVEKSN